MPYLHHNLYVHYEGVNHCHYPYFVEFIDIIRGVTLFLMELQTVTPDLLVKVQPVFYSDPIDAAFKALGVS